MKRKFDVSQFKIDKVGYTVENKKTKFIGMFNDVMVCDVEDLWDKKSVWRLAYNEAGEYLTEFSEYKRWNDINKFKPSSPQYDLVNEFNENLKILNVSDIALNINPEVHVNKTITICSVRDLVDENFMSKPFDFEVKLSNGKSLQRDLVWTDMQKQELIMSVLKNTYIPPVTVVDLTLSEDNTKSRVIQVIDGKQRMTTLRDFVKGKFPLNINGVDYFYENLSYAAKYKINSYSFTGTCYYSYKFDAKYSLTDEEYVRIFEHVNFLGTPVDKQHLLDIKESL